MELSGKIKLVNDTQTFDSGFQKREFVVTTEEQYPQDVKFELIKDRCNLIDAYNVGDNVMVHFNIRGNEYNGRYYVNLQAWRLEAAAQGGQGAPVAEEAPFPTNAQASGGAAASEEDDLPF